MTLKKKKRKIYNISLLTIGIQTWPMILYNTIDLNAYSIISPKKKAHSIDYVQFQNHGDICKSKKVNV